jgi:hypothetical protein
VESSQQTQVAVVGRDNIENLRLADLLRKMIGQENVFRYLETEHLLKLLAERAETR